MLVVAYLAYEAVRRASVPDSSDAFRHAFNIIRFEQEMGIFFEPSLQKAIVDHQWLVTLFNWVYVWGYLPVIIMAALSLYLLVALPVWWNVAGFFLALAAFYLGAANLANTLGDSLGYRWGQAEARRRWRRFV